jgi:hypothetical protein
MRKKELYHYGIKGQKKGLRRYQYGNNTYTPLGNMRYRPRKSIAPAAVGTASLLSLAAVIAHATGKSILSAATSISALSGSAISTVSGVASVGAAAVAAIPTPVWAVALPIAAVYGSTLLVDISDDIFK